MALHRTALVRLTSEFGPPDCTTPRLEVWSLSRPAPRAPVSVILVAAADGPEVWIFDPHDVRAGAAHYRIREEETLDLVADDLRGRIGQSVRV